VLNLLNFVRLQKIHIRAKEDSVAVAYREGGFGVFKHPPQNSEDIGGVLDRISKKNGVSISICSSLCSHTVVIY